MSDDKYLIDRLYEIAHRDSAVAVTVRTDDLRALLSKLRAPEADERAAFEAAIHDEYGTSAASMLLRDADGDYVTMNTEWVFWLKRAALASAPVAGEAIPTDAEVMKVYAETVAEFSDGRGFEAGTVAFARAMLRRYAAPQASDAQCSCPSGDGSLRHPCAVHPQASDAVGVEGAFAGLDDRLDAARWRMAVGLWRIKRVEVFDGVHLSHTSGIPWEDLKRQIDAALSAQPDAQKDEK